MVKCIAEELIVNTRLSDAQVQAQAQAHAQAGTTSSTWLSSRHSWVEVVT
jgi:hypothetical protein